MKKFIVNILLFSIAIVLIFTLITAITDSGLRKSEYGNFKEWNDIFNKRINSNIIIQGSSRAWVQYNTYILDSVLNSNSYNMGMDGSPFDVQYVRYEAYILNNTSPNVIIQNVDWDTMDKNIPVYQKYQFLPFTNDLFFKKLLLENKLLPKVDIYLPCLKYSGETKAIQIGFSEFFGIKHFLSEKHKGFAPSDKNWDGRNFEIRKSLGKIDRKRNLEIENLFDTFLSDCKQKKIRVILVFAPVYYELVNYFANYNELLLYYKDIADKYDIDFLDYSLDPISYDKNNFYNATHLNKKGSELFSTELANRLKTMNILTPIDKTPDSAPLPTPR